MRMRMEMFGSWENELIVRGGAINRLMSHKWRETDRKPLA